MNYLVDVIIIGDSTVGHELLDTLASSKPNVKFAFISQAFKKTTMHDYVNVKYFKREVVYTSFRNRLFSCYFENKDCVFGTHLIVASGVNYEPFMVDGEVIPGVFNTTTDIIPKLAKDQPAIVVYNNAADAKFALEVADKYKQVYLCSDKIDIKNELTKTVAKKLTETENIAILPNTKIKKAITEKGVLQKVELDNYSVINCSAIFVKTNTTPAIDFIPKKLIPRDDNGYLAVASNAESSLVPKCFAVGNCIQKYTKAMGQNLIETILKDF